MDIAWTDAHENDRQQGYRNGLPRRTLTLHRKRIQTPTILTDSGKLYWLWSKLRLMKTCATFMELFHAE